MREELYVTKRDGAREPFDVSKIKKSILLATEGLDVNPLELEWQLFTLTAIAGISGATMRIPSSFFIRLAGGRNTIFLTTSMLLAPAIGTGIVLQHPEWPLWSFQLMALWCGVGGGNFASSMSNISTFFPKRMSGTALGLNAGLGNFGVTTMQIVIPLVLLCWFGMNNLKTVTPDSDHPIIAFLKITWLYTLAFIPSIIGLLLYLPAPTGFGLISMWVAIPLDIIAALTVMRLAAFGPMKDAVKAQFAIFHNKHTWSLTALYIVTFGSFIGFSMALPLSMKVIFGIIHQPDASGVMQHTLANPNAPPVRSEEHTSELQSPL